MKNTQPPISPGAPGYTLIEVIIALGIFVFIISTVIGVIPTGMNQVQTASNESNSMTVMEDIRDDLALALATKMTTSLRYGLTPPGAGVTTPVDLKIKENGEKAAGNEVAVLRITGNVRNPAVVTAPGPVKLNLRATWPANAPSGRETGALELVAAFQP